MGNVIHWARTGVALIVPVAAVLGMLALGYLYPALFLGPFYSALMVWCLYRLLWHWNELPPSERAWTVYGALAGPAMLLTALAGIVRNAPPDLLGPSDYGGLAGLYVAILVYSLVLAGMIEAARKARSSPPPDNRPATDL